MNLGQLIDPERARAGFAAPNARRSLAMRLLEARVAAKSEDAQAARLAQHIIDLAARKRRTNFDGLRTGCIKARLVSLAIEARKPLVLRDFCSVLRIKRVSISPQLHHLVREKWLVADRRSYPARYSPGPRVCS